MYNQSFKIGSLCLPKTLLEHCFQFSWDLQRSQEKINTMLMKNFGWQTKSIMVVLQWPKVQFVHRIQTSLSILNIIATKPKYTDRILKISKGLMDYRDTYPLK